MVSPGEDTQHDDFEHEEREEFTSIHRTGLYSFEPCTAVIVREPEQGAPGRLSELVVDLSQPSLDGWSRPPAVYLPPCLSFSTACSRSAFDSMIRR
jgi:hypothetical protein